jgi:cbb3-type cytochrome c oxidase subunit III
MSKWMIVGLIATAIIAVALPVYARNETGRMTMAQDGLLAVSIEHGQVIYAENCVVCHGTAGQGIAAYPGLDNDGIRTMAYDALRKVIERGRYNTAMAAWGVDEGGVLNDMQLDQLVAMMQHGDWAETGRTVEHLGLSPPAAIRAEISAAVLAELASLPHGEVIVRALPVYAANCTGCHGAEGEGSAIAPALNDPTLRSQQSAEELKRIITNGIPGTLMVGWNQALTDQEIADQAVLIGSWDEIPPGTIPPPDLPSITSSGTEVIAAGGQLYDIACSNCHGSDGQGTRMAPALNVQSFLAETNDLAIKAIISQGVSDTRMPAWGGRLSDDELNALVSFIRAWEPDAPAMAQPVQGGGGGGPPWMRE